MYTKTKKKLSKSLIVIQIYLTIKYVLVMRRFKLRFFVSSTSRQKEFKVAGQIIENLIM